MHHRHRRRPCREGLGHAPEDRPQLGLPAGERNATCPPIRVGGRSWKAPFTLAADALGQRLRLGIGFNAQVLGQPPGVPFVDGQRARPLPTDGCRQHGEPRGAVGERVEGQGLHGRLLSRLAVARREP